nr:NADH dehydrogenase subunit 4 [Cerceris albofasciata]
MMKSLLFLMSMIFLINKSSILLQNLIFLMVFIMIFYMNGMEFYLISMNYGLNFYSFGLLILTFWILGLMFLSVKNLKYKKFMCELFMFFLMLILFLSFSSLSFFLFFLFFEFSLVPTFFLIVFWGFSSQRIVASYYFIFYTMIFSLPMLLVLFMMIMKYGTLSMILNKFYSFNLSILIQVLMMMGFLVKIPVFLLHSWLLKAHVEAPVFGSMILAALLLKLGGYGMLMFMNMIYDYFSNFIKMNLIMISLAGSLILSLVCLCQIDLKILVAYSSIVHMNMMLCGMFTMFNVGVLGAYMMMISHGLSSSGLFYLVNINYERINSRLIFFNKGLMILMPNMSLMWFLICSSNMAAPFSLNLVSELFLLMSLIIFNKNLIWFLILLCMFSFLYSLYLYSFVQHGKNLSMNKFSSGKLIEYLMMLLHSKKYLNIK